MNPADLFLFLAGVGLIWICADRFIVGGTTIARRLGVSNLIVGLTIGALGTSMPELMVSWIAAGLGNTSIAIGNVVGSNMANIGLAIGLGALIYPVPAEKDVMKFGYWIVIISSFLFFIFTLNLKFSRLEGGILLALFIGYVILLIRGHHKTKYIPEKAEGTNSLLSGILLFIASAAGLFVGARLMVTRGTLIAEYLGVSEAVIAIAVVAIGTSLPEIAVVIAGSIKKSPHISLGTIVGSNIINIMLIAGGSAAISPVIIKANENIFMAPAVFAFSLFLLPLIFFGKRQIGRAKGVLLVGIYIVYMAYLI